MKAKLLPAMAFLAVLSYASDVQTAFKIETGAALNSYMAGLAAPGFAFAPDAALYWERTASYKNTDFSLNASGGGAYDPVYRVSGYSGSAGTSLVRRLNSAFALEGKAGISYDASLSSLSPLMRWNLKSGLEWKNGAASFFRFGAGLFGEQFETYPQLDGPTGELWLSQSLSFESGRSARLRLFGYAKRFDKSSTDVRYGGRLGLAQSLGDNRGLSLWAEAAVIDGNAFLAGQDELPWEETFGYESRSLGLGYKDNRGNVEWAAGVYLEYQTPVYGAWEVETLTGLDLEWSFAGFKSRPFVRLTLDNRSQSGDEVTYTSLNAHGGRWF